MAGAPVETLSRVPLFEELDAAELRSIADSMHEANVPAGATVTVEGGPGDGFFVIESGEAEVTIDGQPRAPMKAGDYVGEIAMIDHRPRTATVVATSPAVVDVIGQREFAELLAEEPEIAEQIRATAARRLEDYEHRRQ